MNRQKLWETHSLVDCHVAWSRDSWYSDTAVLYNIIAILVCKPNFAFICLYFIEIHLQERNFKMNNLLNVYSISCRIWWWPDLISDCCWSRSVIYQWWISDGSIARWHYLNFSYLCCVVSYQQYIFSYRYLHFLRLIELIEIAAVRKIKY